MSESEKKGVKETTEFINGMKAAAVLAYKSVKGGGTATEIGMRVGMAIASSPGFIATIQAAIEGMSQIPAELKDLDLGEGIQIGETAVRLIQDSIKEIKE